MVNLLLPPIQHCRVKSVFDINAAEEKFVIDTEPLPDDVVFEIIWFSHIRNYWLTTWRQGQEEYYAGQTLWRGDQPIAFGGGQILLYSPPDLNERVRPDLEGVSVWNRIDKSIGLYGLSVQDAIALQDPSNFVYLFPGNR